MAYKLAKVHGVSIGVVTTHKTTERQQSLRVIPQRLSSLAVFESLNRLGFDSLPIHAASEVERGLRFGQASEVSAHAVNVTDLDKALSDTGFSVAEKIRFKYAVDRLGMLRR
jgi:hypothetical protein